ncbi:MAG: hypothetical protein L6R48_25340 [Planctomycetes bacterium]|nr:hypothetical protein [Planctomycetota bacterium]
MPTLSLTDPIAEMEAAERRREAAEGRPMRAHFEAPARAYERKLRRRQAAAERRQEATEGRMRAHFEAPAKAYERLLRRRQAAADRRLCARSL